MRSAAELRGFARAAAQALARQTDISEFEIYAASAEDQVARIAFTSDIPCRGVEEFKTLHADGFQLRIVMRRDPHEVGTAFEAGDFNLAALHRALKRARRTTVVDPHFPGLSIAQKTSLPAAAAYGDLSRVSGAVLAKCAWQIIGSAIEAFQNSTVSRGENPGLVMGGDISIIRDRIALANSNFSDVRSDESAHFSSSVTAIVESLDAKGTAGAIGASRARLRQASSRLGRDAVRRALTLVDGVRPPSGIYRVVLGPQPVAEILNYMVMGSLTTGAFHASNSAYQGRFGKRVMDGRLSLFDAPRARGGAVHRRITCEGIPARRTDLVRDGYLVGLLSTVYDSHRLETDGALGEKLGANGAGAKFPPVSGYRLGEGGGRRFDSHPGSSGTNLIMRARGGISEREMIRMIKAGIYVGRVWYTYPINCQRAGDFTCTVSGDSYLIRDGMLAEPLAPNSLRINANVAQIFDAPLAIGARAAAATVWGSPEVYYVPAFAVDALALAAVGEVG